MCELLFEGCPLRQCSSRGWLPGPPFVCAICVASWFELWCGWKPTTGCVGQNSSRGRCQMLCVTSLGLPIWSHHTIHSLWLCLLGLGCVWEARLCFRIDLLKSELRQMKIPGFLRSTTSYQLLPLRLPGLPRVSCRKIAEWATLARPTDPYTWFKLSRAGQLG